MDNEELNKYINELQNFDSDEMKGKVATFYTFHKNTLSYYNGIDVQFKDLLNASIVNLEIGNDILIRAKNNLDYLVRAKREIELFDINSANKELKEKISNGITYVRNTMSLSETQEVLSSILTDIRKSIELNRIEAERKQNYIKEYTDYWKAICNSQNKNDFRAFSQRYPDCEFTEFANRRFSELEKIEIEEKEKRKIEAAQKREIEQEEYVKDLLNRHRESRRKPEKRKKRINLIFKAIIIIYFIISLLSPRLFSPEHTTVGFHILISGSLLVIFVIGIERFKKFFN